MAEDTTPILRRKRVLLAKAETTTGTPIALANTDGAFNVHNPELTIDIPVDERETQGGFAYAAGVPGGRLARISFEIELAGSGGVGVPAWASTFLPACGMTVAATTYTFEVHSTLKTLTLGFYEGGLLRSISGAVGTWTMQLTSGRYGRMRFEFLGVYAGESDVALPTPTLPTVIPPRFANTGAVSLAAFVPRISRLEVAAGNQLEGREDANNVAGYRSGIIVDRRAGGSMDPEATLVADRAWYTNFLASTEETLTVTLGTVAQNIITVTGTKCQVFQRPRADRHGIVVEDIQYRLNGESPLSLAFS